MSLDVYLKETMVITCEGCARVAHVSTWNTLFCANITHNLGKMAFEAGIYTALWHPEDLIPGKKTIAADLIAPLREGLAKMKADPASFKQYDATNGWGTYSDFVPWIERYLVACEEYPKALVEVSR